MEDVRIEVEDPRRDDARSLLARHLVFAHENSPPEDVHALDLEALLAPTITFFGMRDGKGTLLAVGALRELGGDHGEVKSMHTIAEARGRGIGRAMLDHLLALARDRGYRRVSLETGTMAAFEPARRLYARAGFKKCQPFADYFVSPNSVCMTLEVFDAAPQDSKGKAE